MANNEQIVEQVLINNTAKEIEKIDKGDYQALRIEAQNFLDQVMLIANMANRAINQNSLKSTLSYIASSMRQVQSFTIRTLALQHSFEQRLNEFMGRTIYLTYVRNDGSFYFYDDANIGKLYQQATANKGRGNISANKIFEANDLETNLQNKIQASMQKRMGVYQEAISRWASNGDENVKNYNPSNKTFYWRLYDNHHISGWTDPISTKGVIAEGYAGAVINEDESVVSSNIEFSLKNLWENHIGKDSIGATIKGDVIWNENGNIQFAIKEGSFSTAMFGQYARLAYNITQIPTLTLGEFENALPKLVKFNKASQQLVESLRQSAEEEIKKMAMSIGVEVT